MTSPIVSADPRTDECDSSLLMARMASRTIPLAARAANEPSSRAFGLVVEELLAAGARRHLWHCAKSVSRWWLRGGALSDSHRWRTRWHTPRCLRVREIGEEIMHRALLGCAGLPRLCAAWEQNTTVRGLKRTQLPEPRASIGARMKRARHGLDLSGGEVTLMPYASAPAGKCVG
jgi:hypothetical protein